MYISASSFSFFFFLFFLFFCLSKCQLSTLGDNVQLSRIKFFITSDTSSRISNKYGKRRQENDHIVIL